jgi:hypothetical protein
MSWNDFSTFLLVSYTSYICILVMCYLFGCPMLYDDELLIAIVSAIFRLKAARLGCLLYGYK